MSSIPEQKVCSVEGCDMFAVKRGMCHGHYRRNLKYGSPTGGKYLIKGTTQRFVEEAVKNPHPTECMECQGHAPLGYGVLVINKTSWLAHRYSLFLSTGVNPPTKNALHSCHNPSCVNPNHLRWGTQAENIQDAADAGRFAVNEQHGGSKLSQEDVLRIRKDARTHTAIAKSYGVSRSLIGFIKNGKKRTYVTEPS